MEVFGMAVGLGGALRSVSMRALRLSHLGGPCTRASAARRGRVSASSSRRRGELGVGVFRAGSVMLPVAWVSGCQSHRWL